MTYRTDMSLEEFEKFLKYIGQHTSSPDEFRQLLKEKNYPHHLSASVVFNHRVGSRLGMAMACSPFGKSVAVRF